MCRNAHAPGERIRIVAIDDDPRLLRRVQRSLDQGGYAAVASTDWNRACELIDEMRPQLVIIDSPGARARRGPLERDALVLPRPVDLDELLRRVSDLVGVGSRPVATP